MEKDRHYTSSGEIKAGAPVPDSVPTRSNIYQRLNSLQAKIDRVEQRVSKEITLANLLGYNIAEMEGLQKRCVEELQSDSRNKMSLVAWVRYIRKATENIETRENSLGSNVIDGIKKYAEQHGYDNINVKILPTFFYHGQHFPRDIDIAIDIDFMPGLEYEESIFRSLKIIPDDSAEDLCITHQDRIEAGVDHTLRVVPVNDKRYTEMIRSVASEVFENAKKIYNKIRGDQKGSGVSSVTRQSKRAVSFKGINRQRDGWYAADKI